MKSRSESFRLSEYIVFSVLTIAFFLLCVCLGSVSIPLNEVFSALLGRGQISESARSIILSSRIPRVLTAALSGASLSLCGGAMQGLLRNPLADGTTLGVTSGASLGAVLSIAFGSRLTVFSYSTVALAMLFAFFSLLLILVLAYKLDCSLSTNTIILVGIIFSMFANSIISLVVTFAGNRVRSIVFWTMGSLSGTGYENALALLAALVICGFFLFGSSRELNAFAVGEDNARNVGVDIKRVKLRVLIFTAALIGTCVSIGGTIGFVGLVIPHIARMLVGPNHRRLLPACVFAGAVFLMLADLISRTILSPLELPIGVVTSLIGSVVFVVVFYRQRKAV
ncbi:MAG: FecCD family ABC transporter permease [Oscillospiraceae bacterium]|jgi:iron complex transport system permease protein